LPRGVDPNDPSTWTDGRNPASEVDTRLHHIPAYGAATRPEPQIPPGWFWKDGVLFDDQAMPRGEKPLETPVYDPIDTTVDLATGGASAVARNAGKAGP
jgi:hypothetical protein